MLGASPRLVQAPAWCKPPLGASLRLVQAFAWCKPPLGASDVLIFVPMFKMLLLYWKKSQWAVTLLVVIAVLLVIACSELSQKAEQPAHPTGFLNLHDSVKYVGMNTCRQCHSNIHETFQHTGMGSSFGSATREKSSAVFTGHRPVYDSRFNYYYYPFWAGDTLMLREFRLAGVDTIHKREQRIDYIIGSGQHTNSHLFSVNGYLFQAPITWYAQKGKWDLPPGFDEGAVTRFSRIISLECMSCHNAYPDFIEGSRNRFRNILQGIDCERCHGPGSLHVQEKMAGKIVDTSKYTDYTIVNPKKLPVELQMEICQRCHLQGNAVLKPGKSFFDFRPGMKLTEVFDVFMPSYEGDQSSFIMASHVERLKMSKCWKASNNSFNCISCHNPHVSVKVTGKQAFNQPCIQCHSGNKNQSCTEQLSIRNKKGDNCVACHMPASGTEDIPHVTTHDHYIRKPVKLQDMPMGRVFAGLVCLTDPSPGPLTRANAWMNYFEKFDTKKTHLDSARYWLNLSPASPEKIKSRIHLNYLAQDFESMKQMRLDFDTCSVCRLDGWTAYRMGEAFQQTGVLDQAGTYYVYAVRAMPHDPEFRNKLGNYYLHLQEFDKAEKWFKAILKDQPDFVPALNNLGYLKILQQKPGEARPLLEKALMLDPDYEKALANLASWHLTFGNKTETRKLATRLIQIAPGNPDYMRLFKTASR